MVKGIFLCLQCIDSYIVHVFILELDLHCDPHCDPHGEMSGRKQWMGKCQRPRCHGTKMPPKR